MKSIYICIPTYNEASNVPILVERLDNELRNSSKSNSSSDNKGANEYSFIYLFIDDNSPDGTGDIIRKLQETHTNIKLIVNEKKSGLGKAYIQAFNFAIQREAFAVMEMDADLSHDPKYIPAMVEKLNEFDLVIGSRYIRNGGTLNWNFKRKLISKFGNFYSRLILGVKINDLTGGFNLYRTDVFKVVDLSKIESNGYSFQIELKYRTIRSGFKVTEVPIIFKEREEGVSKFGGNIIKEAIKKPWQLRFSK